MKKQTRKVGVAGGFYNQIMGNNKTEPIVGEGATRLWYSDREPFEVTWVSECGNKCEIRPMDTEWCGIAYGDEQYKYSSNPDKHIVSLEWCTKRNAWGIVTYKVQIIKALADRLYKEYGWGWTDFLPEGYTFDDLIDGEKNGIDTKLKLITGVTKRYKEFHKISIIFGEMSKYRDPHF